VTRRIITQLAADEGIGLVERDTTVAMLKNANEAFLTSSVAEIVPVVRLDEHPIAAGKPGPVTKLLQRRYRTFARRAAAAD